MNTLMSSDEDSATATNSSATDNAAIELAAHWNGPQCEKCDTPMKSDLVTVCRKCGWYASLNQFVDVDEDWEAYGDDVQQAAQPDRPSHVEVWLNLLPRWAWVVIAVVVAVVMESVVARLITPDGSAIRTAWSLTQLAVGVMTFLACHIFIFLLAVADDADTGVLDIMLKPLKLWMRAFGELPKRQWVTDAAAASLTAVLMSIVVIGGLPYERFWDWGFEQPTKNANLLGAVASQMQKVDGDGADNLEDAVSDFANSQNLQPGDPGYVPPPKPRLKIDCVILGYRLDTEGRMQSLILGTALREKLVYAGSVLPQLSAQETANLMQRLEQIPAKQPYLTVQVNARWVVPKYSCRISYESQDRTSGQLSDPRWEDFLGTLQ